ncbi:hypothetical protein HBO32_31760 [Pseudomonas nitroreducens]|uniref:hypothetical protein n=1 Tax=Pseudomonas nitroreducens TaxID=46680 RepID=UPI001476469A|nr:hypothetical protein [Pseudomonas nitroreducens]NMZ77678.1 hypothetical protein [Pseudomonas nitroreducens]
MKLNKNGVVALGSLLAAAAGSSAMAAGVDFSPITAGVDWSTVITGILAVAALAAGVYVPSTVMFFASAFELGFGVKIVLAALVLRFILRRIPLIG